MSMSDEEYLDELCADAFHARAEARLLGPAPLRIRYRSRVVQSAIRHGVRVGLAWPMSTPRNEPVPPTRETPRAPSTLPEIVIAADALAADLRKLGPWAKPFADRAQAIARAVDAQHDYAMHDALERDLCDD